MTRTTKLQPIFLICIISSLFACKETHKVHEPGPVEIIEKKPAKTVKKITTKEVSPFLKDSLNLERVSELDIPIDTLTTGDYIILLGNTRCMNSSNVAPTFEKVALKYQSSKLKFYYTNQSLPGYGSSPRIVYMKDGIYLDQKQGSNSERDYDGILNLLVRNKLVLSDRKFELPDFRKYYSKRRDTREVSLSSINLSGVDFSRQDMSHSIITGSDLRNANFSQADLQGVYFSNSDLTGANLKGANLKGTVWHNAICPNGDRSLKLRNGCADSM